MRLTKRQARYIISLRVIMPFATNIPSRLYTNYADLPIAHILSIAHFFQKCKRFSLFFKEENQ